LLDEAKSSNPDWIRLKMAGLKNKERAGYELRRNQLDQVAEKLSTKS
jgi:hypothetical protein